MYHEVYLREPSGLFRRFPYIRSAAFQRDQRVNMLFGTAKLEAALNQALIPKINTLLLTKHND